jgi:hypothetical protein
MLTGMIQGSSSSATQIYLDLDIPEVQKYRTRFSLPLTLSLSAAWFFSTIQLNDILYEQKFKLSMEMSSSAKASPSSYTTIST